MQGQDAVIAAVGSSGIARNLILALPEAGVRRAVMTSSRSVVATRPFLPLFFAWLILSRAYADLARAEGMFEFSGLDWTIVRATMLTNAAYTGRVHIDFERNATGGDWTLGRADYAMTLLDVVENPQMSGKALGVGGAKAGEQLIDIRQAESSMISQHWTNRSGWYQASSMPRSNRCGER